MTSRREDQRALIRDLRESGHPEAQSQIEHLQTVYHAHEMAGLTHDVYASAEGTGNPPHGWVRGATDVAVLREMMPGIDLSDKELLELFAPDNSGFRAEIYLPDPTVVGPDFKPTLVFKGSTGNVIENGEKRATALEDFLGNNLPQAIGVKADYYIRAMDVATKLRQYGLEFDIAGHSLGGGMAAAASAVSGMRAVTFNAAGLHPDTAKSFAQASGNLPLFDTDQTVTAWQVQGDVLNDGLQRDIRGVSEVQRERLAVLFTNTVAAMQGTPAGRDFLEQRLLPGIPEVSHPAVRAFLAKLEQGDASAMIRDLPEAAGKRMPPLVAMTHHEQMLVGREDRASMAELHQLSGPVLTVLAMGARGANVGAQAGEVVANGGRALGDGLSTVGDASRIGTALAGTHIDRTWQSAGVVLAQGTQTVGEFTAQARMFGAHGAAAIDHAQGLAGAGIASARGGLLRSAGDAVGVWSDAWRDGLHARAERVEAAGDAMLDRNRGEAAAVLAQGRAGAQARREVAGSLASGVQAGADAFGAQARNQLVYVGERLDAGLEVAGAQLTRVTAHAPTAGAGLGGLSGVIVSGTLTFDPRTPHGRQHWSSAIELVREGGPAVSEAVARHGMDTAVLASMERHVAEQEAAAKALLRELDRGSDMPTLQTPSALRSGGVGAALEDLLSAVRQGDAEAAKQASHALLEAPGAQAWVADGQARLAARDQAPGISPEVAAQHAPHRQAPQGPAEQAAPAH